MASGPSQARETLPKTRILLTDARKTRIQSQIHDAPPYARVWAERAVSVVQQSQIASDVRDTRHECMACSGFKVTKCLCSSKCVMVCIRGMLSVANKGIHVNGETLYGTHIVQKCFTPSPLKINYNLRFQHTSRSQTVRIW
jgi:hypothetical protein